MNGFDKAKLYWNTVKYLKPIQIRYQIGNRIFRGRQGRLLDSVKKLTAPKAQEINILIPELDCESGYLQRFDAEKLLEGCITLLHEEHQIGKVWNIQEASHLWNYNLHYLEFLIPLAVQYKETADERYFDCWVGWVESWLAQSAGDSFEPYTISIRIPNILISMELLGKEIRGTELWHTICTSIYQQYRYLLHTRELALLANHYFENIKAIVISSVLFGELEIYHKYFDLLLRELDEQILPDGLHFELSPMYHRIILEDLLRVYTVLNSCRHKCDAEKLIPAIQAMTSAMVNFERGFDRIPLFNDSGNNVAKGKCALLKAVKKICVYKEAEIGELKHAGYYKLYRDDMAVLFDCGDIGPAYMGGHSHCDCLSFELCVDGKALFVNSGTGQYQGELRTFFRCTAAHNTVMLDDREQSQLWGEHRAARRISRMKGSCVEGVVTGQFTGFQGDLFRRKLQWEQDRKLIITDDFKAHDKGRHTARQFLHLAPGYEYERGEKQEVYVKEGNEPAAVIHLPAESEYLIHTEGLITYYARDFGEFLRKQVLEIRTQFEEKIQIKTEIEISKRK